MKKPYPPSQLECPQKTDANMEDKMGTPLFKQQHPVS